MKITNMEEMGKAIDDGKELEILNSRGVDDKEEWWGEIRDSLCWMNMPLLVSEGRIRTKPKTITLYEYKCQRPGNHQIMWLNRDDYVLNDHSYTDRKIIDGQITEEPK